jgi:hypothetical protein
MQLRRLQLELQHHLLGAHSGIAAAIVDAPPLPTAERLGIYRNAYQVRLIEALGDTYPILHKILGDEMFSALGEAFVAAHPSVYRSIRWYGQELGEFMASTPPYAEQPILAELARFEWTLAEVFDAPDAASLPRAALSAVDPAAWSALKFRFHPSLRRLLLSWNAPAAWRSASRDETPAPPELAQQPILWLLWRQNLQNFFRSLDDAEATALDALLRGGTFGEMCAALAARLPEDQIPLRAATLLGGWADSGIIIEISPAAPLEDAALVAHH